MGLFSRKPKEKALQAAEDHSWVRIFDWRPGAWQQHTPYDTSESIISYAPVFACITLISGDIGKLRPMVQGKTQEIWEEKPSDITALLKKPNTYQNHIQFKEYWQSSKLIYGNAYALKYRDNRGKVIGLFVLDPARVTPLVSDMGEVFYQLNSDNLSRLREKSVTVPASEIIHDRENCLYHPLIGLPPLYACTVTGQMGIKMETNAKTFFENGSSPSGVLTAPGSISDEAAIRLREYFESNFTGTNSGRVAVAGDGLKYEPMRMSNVDAQLLQMFNWTGEAICSVFHVPAYMVGIGPMPTHNNIEALTQQYYSQCLQKRIESMEAVLDDGLELKEGERVQLDLDGLFRMDSKTLVETLGLAMGAGFQSPDEARRRLNLKPVPGGEYPYLQQQNYSLEALAQRDATNPLSAPPPAEPEDMDDDDMMMMSLILERELMGETA